MKNKKCEFVYFDKLSTNGIERSFFNKLFIFFILGLRPLFGIAHCRYPVSCTKFAVWQLQEKSLLVAIWAICKRVISCKPW